PHCAKTVDVPAAESNPLTPLPGVANGEADQQPHVPALPVAAPGDTKPPGGPTVLPLKGFRKDKVFWFGLGGVVVSGTVLLMVLTSLKGTNNTDRPMSVAADTATARRPEGVAVAPSPPVSASTSPPVPVSALSPVHE